MKQYDYLIVGAGLYGAVFAHEAKKAGKKCLVIDKRSHIAGNIYTEPVEGINVHRYGAHIFHTNNKTVWQYVNQFAEFNRYTNSPVANYHGEIYNLPFNMNTFNKMWGVVTPAEAKARIEQQKAEAGITDPQNLEEQAISLVGTDIYEKLIKGYTGKQWGRPCTELPAFIIKRLPVRFTYDNNYFNALYQGIPNGGYTAMVENMLEGTEVRLNVDYLADREALNALADKVVYTGPVDAYFGYRLGALQYRSVRFETECRTLHGCRTGEAKITKGYRLKAKYIIHTVGPIYSGTPEDAVQLADCYRNSLELARSYDIHSIAFPAISTGVYGYPLDAATQIAVDTVTDWLQSHVDYDMRVIFCCFDARTEQAYQAKMKMG